MKYWPCFSKVKTLKRNYLFIRLKDSMQLVSYDIKYKSRATGFPTDSNASHHHVLVTCNDWCQREFKFPATTIYLPYGIQYAGTVFMADVSFGKTCQIKGHNAIKLSPAERAVFACFSCSLKLNTSIYKGIKPTATKNKELWIDKFRIYATCNREGKSKI